MHLVYHVRELGPLSGWWLVEAAKEIIHMSAVLITKSGCGNQGLLSLTALGVTLPNAFGGAQKWITKVERPRAH